MHRRKPVAGQYSTSSAPEGACRSGVRTKPARLRGSRVRYAGFSLLLGSLLTASGCGTSYDTVAVPPERAPATRDSLLAALSGNHVELVLSDGRVLTGECGVATADSITVKKNRTSREQIPLANISAVRFGRSPAAPAIGFLFVGAAGVLAGGMIGASVSEEPMNGMFVGAAAGLLVGGTIGAYAGQASGRGTEYRFMTTVPP